MMIGTRSGPMSGSVLLARQLQVSVSPHPIARRESPNMTQRRWQYEGDAQSDSHLRQRGPLSEFLDLTMIPRLEAVS
jgi:hypothetical protein